MKRIVAVLLLVAIGSLLLVGCPAPETTPTPSTSPTPGPSPSPTITGGGTLKLYGTEPFVLDPALAADANSHSYIAQVFSGLLKLDDDLAPVPDIAGGWKLSPDRRTYTFTLREDVVFQDGRGVTADDFKYSWERACSPATGSPVAKTYLGDIVGVDDVLAGRTTEISGLRVIDDYTLEVTIDAPRSYFLYKLSYPTTFVVDRNDVARDGEWWRRPNGTGPFWLTGWTEDQSIILERNTRYYGLVAGVEKVEFQFLSGVPMNLYETGEIDVTGVSALYIDRATDENGPFRDQLQIAPELSFYWIGFNTTRPPFDDINIRKAFTMAIDKEKIVSLVYRDLVAVAAGILPPGLPGYNESVEGLEFDVVRARELIARSKYGNVANLPPITFTTGGYGGLIAPSTAAIITQWRENLGVEVTVRQLEPERFIYNLREEKDELFDMGWIADYPHPQDFLEVLFGTGAENNFAEYSNPAVDAILEQAALEEDTQRSLELYRQAEQMLIDDAACLPLWFGENYILIKPYVQGYKLNPLGYAKLNEVKIRG